MMDHPLDLGIVLGSTNDDIWAAEMRRHDGLIVMMRMSEKDSVAADPPASARQVFQSRMAAVPFEAAVASLTTMMQELAPHVNAPIEEIEKIIDGRVEQARARLTEKYGGAPLSHFIHKLLNGQTP